MTAPAQGSPADSIPKVAFQSLATLNQLILEAGRCETRQELIFHALNKTIAYVPYDRAYLFGVNGKAVRFLGASGTSQPDRQAGPASDRRLFLRKLSPPAAPTHLTEEGVDDTLRAPLQRLRDENGGNDILLLPIGTGNRPVAVLWLERWGGGRWQEGDGKRLQPLASGYGNAWRIFGRGATGLRERYLRSGTIIAAGLLLALGMAMVMIDVPLRIVAPCEVVPLRPMAITAPIEGVVERLDVEPGQRVSAGQQLFTYEKQIPMDELEAARQRVSVIVAQYEQAQAEALGDPKRRPDIEILKRRLAEEETRVSMAEFRVARLDVTSPASGVVLFDNPNEWRGRPVTVGERMMTLMRPTESKLKIWLPQDDKIPVDRSQPVHVLLNTATSDTTKADLRFISKYAEPIPDGGVGFLAEATWRGEPEPHWMGLEGSAVLYGPRVPLYQWLFRKPVNATRRFLGW